MQTGVTSIQTGISSIQGTSSAIQGNVATLQASVGTLQALLDQMRADVASVKTGMGAEGRKRDMPVNARISSPDFDGRSEPVELGGGLGNGSGQRRRT